MLRQYLLLFALTAILGVGACGRKAYIHKITDKSIAGPEQVDEIYYSDYFSFQGSDEKGPVLLAIDNNRWKNTKGYALDHFLSMFDHNDWVLLQGSKTYKNRGKELVNIPDDEILTFQGTPKTGLLITSAINKIVLKIDPLKPATTSENGFAKFNMLSAAASLTWKGKEIKGRVIEEYLVMPYFSKKRKQFLKFGAGTFTGLYLSIDGKGDIYIHHKTGKSFSFIGGMDDGFIRLGGIEKHVSGFKMDITSKKKKLFYSMPMGYSILLSAGSPKMQLTLHTIDRYDVSGFIVAAFSMAAVEGTLIIDDKNYPVYGFAELIE